MCDILFSLSHTPKKNCGFSFLFQFLSAFLFPSALVGIYFDYENIGLNAKEILKSKWKIVQLHSVIFGPKDIKTPFFSSSQIQFYYIKSYT